jgi:chromosome segregation ATPase
MSKMTSPLLLVALAFVPTDGRAQPVAATDSAARDALAVEVRLLRQTVERLAVVAVRSHVLVGRLAAQQQRVAREQDAIDRTEEAIDAADRTQERTRATLAQANRLVGNVVEEPRSELRREVENLRAELDHHDRQLTRLRTRLSQAEQSLKSEQQAYAELEASLSGLVREIERPNR